MKKRLHRGNYVSRVFLLLSLACLLPFSLCRFSMASDINDLLNVLNRISAIQTTKGKIVVVNYEISRLRYPISFTVKGQLPKGSVDLFAFFTAKDGSAWMSQPCTDNPFKRRDLWTVGFFKFMEKDRLVAYDSMNNTAATLIFNAYERCKITIEELTTHQITTLLFGCAPSGEVQKLDLSNAHIVNVVLK